MVLLRPTSSSRTNTHQSCPFPYRGLECKSRKSRDTWSNRHIWPWSTKQSRPKANRVLPRECTGHSKHPLPTTQETTLHISSVQSLSHVRLLVTPWTAAHQAPPPMEFSRQEYWSGVPLPFPMRPSRTNTPKRCPFHYRGLECKSRKSRNT